MDTGKSTLEARLKSTMIWAFRSTAWCIALLSAAPGHVEASLDPDKPISQYIHQNWSAAQGLPQNSVLAAAQTSDGYLWLGTEEGLVRFDGVRFTIFDQQSAGLKSNVIRALLVDRHDDLWIGTSGGGVSRLSHGVFTSFSTRNGLTNDSILSLYEDEAGALWIGTDGGGLIRFKDGKFRAFTKMDGLADNVVFSISGDRHGTVWVGTHGGLSKLARGTISTVKAGENTGDAYIRAVYAETNGVVWAGTNSDGLLRIEGNGVTRYTTQNGLTGNEICSIYRDRAGTLWIGTGDGGLDRLAHGEFSSFTVKDGLPGKDVLALLEDREGSLWVGTTSGGLNCLKRGPFTTITKTDGLKSDVILPVYQDHEGALWMGSDEGLMQWKDGQVKLYTIQQGLPDRLVLSVTEDRQGSMWIGTRRGLARLSRGKIETFRSKNGSLTDFVICTYTDRDGNVWIGTRGGLSRFDGRTFTTFTTRDGLSNNYVLSIAEDKQGSLWIGTGSGLNQLQGGHFRCFYKRDGLSSDYIMSIFADRDGTVWLGTNGGGLNRLQNGKFTTYTTREGLFSDLILGIIGDGRGRLWMTCNKGIFAVSKDQLKEFANGAAKAIMPTVFGPADGLKSSEANGGFQPAAWELADGRLCFPTMKGVGMVNPKELDKHEVAPSVIVERVLIDGKNYPVDKALVIPPGNGKLEFQFTAPSFIAPGKLQFRYMLEGFDKEWTEAGSRRVAYYTNIPHGEYRFRVRAGTENGWNENRPPVTLTLRPHYYETTAFHALASLAVLGTCILLYQLRVRQLELREEKLVRIVNERTSALLESEAQLRSSRDQLEIRVQERTRELLETNQALEAEILVRRRTEEQLTSAKEAAEQASRAKSDFLTNMSHEIRTPINGIIGMTDLALTTTLDTDQQEYLEIARTSADSLLAIVNNILDFSRIEARELKLDKSPFRFRKFLEEVLQPVSASAHEKNLSLTASVEAIIPDEVVSDPVRLRQVLMNLLDNAIKFTRRGGVTLSVCAEQFLASEVVLHFAVSDTGIGIPAEKRETIFEAFSQADTSLTRRYGGTGLGLTISSRLAELLGGRLWVESEVGEGSTFHFTARIEFSRQDARSPKPEAEEARG